MKKALENRTTHVYAAFAVQSELDVLKTLRVTVEQGLSQTEAEHRLAQNGKNVLVALETKWVELLLRQFKSPYIYLLIVAAILSIALDDLMTGIFIFLFIAIDVVLTFFQEFRSEKILSMLKKYFIHQFRVVR